MVLAFDNIAKVVQEMSQSFRDKVREFLTILKAKFNGQDIHLEVTEKMVDPVW